MPDEIHRLQAQIQDYERLVSVLQTISSSLQVDVTLQQIIEAAMNLCNAQHGSIILIDPTSRQEGRTLIRHGDTERKVLDHYLNTLFSGWILRFNKPLLSDNLIATFGEKEVAEKYHSITSVLSVPLELHGEIIGVINLITLECEKKFDERALQLIQILAAQCAQFIANARLHEEIFAETTRLRKEVHDKYAFHGIIGHSAKMREVFALLERTIPTEGRVILEGESGTGKELIARVIHYCGPRKDAPFVAVDCGALPVNLLESELFGYTKGAFTGAVRDKKGLFEEADNGTLFLDEIANIPTEIQVKFLRAIQEGEIRPLGSTQLKKVDVRIIAATSENLRTRMEAGKFRRELFYRLNVVNIILPPLRERREDIAILANHFLNKIASKYGKKIMGFKAETISLFEAYSWPGNIRELENVVERTVILAEWEVDYISVDFLPPELRFGSFGTSNLTITDQISKSMKTMKNALEREMLLKALQKHNWNQSSAAKELGVHEKTVRNKMIKLHIKKS